MVWHCLGRWVHVPAEQLRRGSLHARKGGRGAAARRRGRHQHTSRTRRRLGRWCRRALVVKQGVGRRAGIGYCRCRCARGPLPAVRKDFCVAYSAASAVQAAGDRRAAATIYKLAARSLKQPVGVNRVKWVHNQCAQCLQPGSRMAYTQAEKPYTFGNTLSL